MSLADANKWLNLTLNGDVAEMEMIERYAGGEASSIILFSPQMPAAYELVASTESVKAGTDCSPIASSYSTALSVIV